MKIYLCIFPLILLLSCQPKNSTRHNEEKIAFDTVRINDTARNLSVLVCSPSSGIAQIDDAIKVEIDKQKEDFINDLDEKIKEDRDMLSSVGSDFQTEPVSAFKNEKLTSILYRISLYYAGAPHPFDKYCSFNFDNRSFKKISFQDFFTINSAKDTTFLTALITKAIKIENVAVSNLNKMDFSIEQDTISFNFDDYEIAGYAEGLIRGRLNKAQLKNKIREEYLQ